MCWMLCPAWGREEKREFRRVSLLLARVNLAAL